MVDIRDEGGKLVETRAAMSWNDYYCKKDVTGVTYAKKLKREFWRVFNVSRADVRKADHNLDEYLRKRVSDLMYQARLDAVKFHEECDDNQARNIHLTEEEYINSKLPWCSQDAWFTPERYMEKRKIAQASRLKSKDCAQNRGGSRPFAETQQLLANYSARTELPENSKDLDAQTLYAIERGMAHGRVPIGDGCVDKQALAATAKARRSSSRTAAYQNMLDECEQLQERNDALEQTNKKLNENNEILIEENSVNRALMMKIFEDLHKEPPADLMERLANLEARRHQVSISSHAATHPLEMLSGANDIVTDDDDYDNNEMDDSNSYDDDSNEDDCGSDDSRGSEDDMRGSEDDMSNHEEEDGCNHNEDSGADISDN